MCKFVEKIIDKYLLWGENKSDYDLLAPAGGEVAGQTEREDRRG